MAIAHDAAPTGSFVNPATSHTQSHTCTGANRGLVVGVASDTTDVITGATYAGVSMTLVDKGTSSGRWHYTFYLNAPATGTNNIVVTASTSAFIEINGSSYTGVKQTGQPAVFGKNVTGGLANGKSLSLTSLADNSWMVMSGVSESGSLVAGASTTLRTSALINAIFDSNGVITPAGARTLAFTAGGTSDTSAIGLILEPALEGGGSVGMASEVDTALALSSAGSLPVGLAAEVDTALALLPPAGFNFDTGTGLIFGDLAGALTGLAREAAVGMVLRVYAVASPGALVHESGTLTTDSNGRLPRYTHASLSAAATYHCMLIRNSDGEVLAVKLQAS